MHGPSVAVAGKGRRKAYLIAFLDDATRLIPYAAFAMSENTAAFLPVFKQALLRRGIPERLYVDNGANFRSHHLALVCAKLGVALIHARPYQPQGKGKLERWFRTCRAQLLAHLGADDTASLEALNRRLWAFVEGEYHHAPHRGLDADTPLERWTRSAEDVRFPEPALDLDELFLFECMRRVQKDRTVSLHGVVYEVDAALVGEKITLRYDPSAPPGRPVQVLHDSQLVQLAKPLDAYANCFVKRHRPSWNLQPDAPAPEPTHRALALRELRRRDTRSADDDDNTPD
jgi:putative transposase